MGKDIMSENIVASDSHIDIVKKIRNELKNQRKKSPNLAKMKKHKLDSRTILFSNDKTKLINMEVAINNRRKW